MIREDEPPPRAVVWARPTPSRRSRPTAGRSPAARRLVRGDLDWVVMKALEKDRDRRYESAAAFAADVERFLNHEPVAAGPPTVTYRARKFVRRNRKAVIATRLVLLALIGGVIGTTWGLIRAAEQPDRAEQATDRAFHALEH